MRLKVLIVFVLIIGLMANWGQVGFIAGLFAVAMFLLLWMAGLL